MKRGNPCCKCGGTSIMYIPGGKLDDQNKAVFSDFWSKAVIRIGRYICVECGYTEEWVDRESDMDTVQRLSGGS